MQPSPPTALPAIFSVEALAALSIAALAALSIAMIVGGVTRKLLRTREGDRFHTQPIANATVRAVRRVTFVLALLVLVFPALDLAGLNVKVGLHAQDISRFATQGGARILPQDARTPQAPPHRGRNVAAILFDPDLDGCITDGAARARRRHHAGAHRRRHHRPGRRLRRADAGQGHHLRAIRDCRRPGSPR